MHPSITLVLNSTDRFTAESRWKIWYLLNSETLNILFTGGAKRTAARVGNTDQVNICIKRKTDCQSWTKSKLEATKHAVSRMCYVNSCHCGQIRDSEDNDETDCSANNADEIGLQGSRFFFSRNRRMNWWNIFWPWIQFYGITLPDKFSAPLLEQLPTRIRSRFQSSGSAPGPASSITYVPAFGPASGPAIRPATGPAELPLG